MEDLISKYSEVFHHLGDSRMHNEVLELPRKDLPGFSVDQITVSGWEMSGSATILQASHFTKYQSTGLAAACHAGSWNPTRSLGSYPTSVTNGRSL